MEGHRHPYAPHRLKRGVAGAHPTVCFEPAYVKHCYCNIKCSTNAGAHETTTGRVVHWTLDCKCIGLTKEDQSDVYINSVYKEADGDIHQHAQRSPRFRVSGLSGLYCLEDLSSYAPGSRFPLHGVLATYPAGTSREISEPGAVHPHQ